VVYRKFVGGAFMSDVVKQMLERYSPANKKETENALKEILQELALIGLYRSKFFEKAAFYGGTALRILYGLPRFSEDLDFTLFDPNPKFKLDPYFSAMRMEMAAFGFEVDIETVRKPEDRVIESAFMKANTKIRLMQIEPLSKFSGSTQMNEKLQIKFEVDIDPASGFDTETKYLFQPIGAPILTLKQPDLFAGKLHALLYRKWKHRVKGRDFYDYAWYLSKKIPIRGAYFFEKAKQSGELDDSFLLNKKTLKKLVVDRIESVDLEKAKSDVRPFIRDARELDVWSMDYFSQLTDRLEIV
jgi:predicted nucleotidyltransferase component of viral defense system